ncbi:TspO/MBR family protein [Methanolacinia paynteri]|uniref:TspO/MBR family protein n=1 Tax=Methanolacinia paynteri TaxID=230356 RepID=UPI00064E1865|nr:TspO/MBR family protein [Methanolacinia paynteri]
MEDHSAVPNPNDEKIKKGLLFTGSVLVCLATGGLGSIFTKTGQGTWYAEELIKPDLTPPGFVFGIVWTILYILMGISLYLLLARDLKLKEVRIAVSIFLIQLVLNFGWSYLFFGFENPFAGFICIILLWIFILLTIVSSYRVDKNASYLLVPYIIWVTFAAFLNLQILVLN